MSQLAPSLASCLLCPTTSGAFQEASASILLIVVNVANFDSLFGWDIFDFDFLHFVLSSCYVIFAADFALVAPCRAFAVLSAVVLSLVLVH
jgi:hypothetical protein